MLSRTLLRPMAVEDVPTVAALAAGRGYVATESALARHLQDPDGAGFVVEHNGAIVGVITVSLHLDYALLGPLVLAPSHQGAGLDLHLVRRAFSTLARRGVRTVEAEVSPEVLPVYRVLGFVPVEETIVLAGHTLTAAPKGPSVRRAEAHDLLDVGQLDADTFGYGRKGLFLSLLEDVPQGAHVARRGADGVDGFVFASRGSPGWSLGPWIVARGAESAAAPLLDAALTSLEPGEVTVRVPASAAAALKLLQERGFREVARLGRVRFGEPRSDLENLQGELARGTGPIY
ncbi:MAG TPA: GNAT family N-acetyltransferase [Candidatus Thermoplasmatota archaeon]|nr:GNAT family N-acetyltransferase [Candidatus Thermoplasmatota archaeon]